MMVCLQIRLASTESIECICLLVVESSHGQPKGEQSKGGGDSEEECPPLAGGLDGGGAADTGPAVERQREVEQLGDEGSGVGDCYTQGAEEGGGDAPEVEHVCSEKNVWYLCEAKKAVHHDQQVDGCLAEFPPDPHEDGYGDEEEEDTARDPKHMQSCVLLR